MSQLELKALLDSWNRCDGKEIYLRSGRRFRQRMESLSDEIRSKDTEGNWRAQLKTLRSDLVQKDHEVTVLKTEVKKLERQLKAAGLCGELESYRALERLRAEQQKTQEEQQCQEAA